MYPQPFRDTPLILALTAGYSRDLFTQFFFFFWTVTPRGQGVARLHLLPNADLGAGPLVGAQGRLVPLGWLSPNLCVVSKDLKLQCLN